MLMDKDQIIIDDINAIFKLLQKSKYKYNTRSMEQIFELQVRSNRETYQRFAVTLISLDDIYCNLQTIADNDIQINNVLIMIRKVIIACEQSKN